MKRRASNHAARLPTQGNVSQAAAKRDKFVTATFRGLGQAAACNEAGISPRTARRVRARIDEGGQLGDAPRSGRPLKYTDTVLGQAVELLVQHKEGFMTAPMLLHELEQEGVLPPGSDVATFRERLKKHVENMGYQLITNSTQTTFFISNDDKKARVQYCREMLKELKKHPLPTLVWVDETQLASAQHAKGGLCTSHVGASSADVFITQSAVCTHACMHEPTLLADQWLTQWWWVMTCGMACAPHEPRCPPPICRAEESPSTPAHPWSDGGAPEAPHR
jgi:transposase